MSASRFETAQVIVKGVLGGGLGVLGIVVGIWLGIVWPSDELKVAGVAFGVTVASVGIGFVFSAMSSNDAANTDQRLDEIEARLDGIERSAQAIDSRPAPKGWVRALFYETQPKETKAVTDTPLAQPDSD